MKCEAIVKQFCEHMQASEHLSGINIFTEFPGTKQELPLRQTIISVGLKSVKVEADDENPVIKSGNSLMEATMSVTICSPKYASGNSVCAHIDHVLASFEELQSIFAFKKILVGELKYSNTLGTLVTVIEATVMAGQLY